MCLSCRSRKMLQNEYLVAKFGFDTAKNEPRQVLHFLAGKLEFNTVVDDRIRQLRYRCRFRPRRRRLGRRHRRLRRRGLPRSRLPFRRSWRRRWRRRRQGGRIRFSSDRINRIKFGQKFSKSYQNLANFLAICQNFSGLQQMWI